MPQPGCKARRELDEYVCVECALRWGVDEDPPACRIDLAARKAMEHKTPYRRSKAYRPRRYG